MSTLAAPSRSLELSSSSSSSDSSSFFAPAGYSSDSVTDLSPCASEDDGECEDEKTPVCRTPRNVVLARFENPVQITPRLASSIFLQESKDDVGYDSEHEVRASPLSGRKKRLLKRKWTGSACQSPEPDESVSSPTASKRMIGLGIDFIENSTCVSGEIASESPEMAPQLRLHPVQLDDDISPIESLPPPVLSSPDPVDEIALLIGLGIAIEDRHTPLLHSQTYPSLTNELSLRKKPTLNVGLGLPSHYLPNSETRITSAPSASLEHSTSAKRQILPPHRRDSTSSVPCPPKASSFRRRSLYTIPEAASPLLALSPKVSRDLRDYATCIPSLSRNAFGSPKASPVLSPLVDGFRFSEHESYVKKLNTLF